MKNPHIMRVDTAREQRDRHFSRAHEGEGACERETKPSETAGLIVVNCLPVERGTYCEPMITKWRKLSSGELRSSKLPQSSAGGGDARRQRTETISQPEEPVMKRSQRRGKARIVEKEHRGRRTCHDDE